MCVSDDLNKAISGVAQIARVGTRMRDFTDLVSGVEQFGSFDDARDRSVLSGIPRLKVDLLIGN